MCQIAGIVRLTRLFVRGVGVGLSLIVGLGCACRLGLVCLGGSGIVGWRVLASSALCAIRGISWSSESASHAPRTASNASISKYAPAADKECSLSAAAPRTAQPDNTSIPKTTPAYPVTPPATPVYHFQAAQLVRIRSTQNQRIVWLGVLAG
jgi:hypothetical protein